MMLRKWLRFGRKVWDSNFGRLADPYKLTFVTTKECHSRCINCEIWKVKPKNELTLDEVTQLAKNSPFLSWVDFTGGEPTDRKDFVEVIQAFLDNCPDLLFVHFPTNGLKTKRIEKVVSDLLQIGAPNLTITVSIDGPPEVNDPLRGIPGDFRKAVETFQAIERLGVKVYVGMTLYTENVRLIDATVAAIREIHPTFSYRQLHVNIPHISGHFYENKDVAPLPTGEMVDQIDQFMKKRGFPRSPFDLLERMYHKRVRQYVDSKACPQDCASLMASCYVSETGMVFPCLIWDEPLGNIRDHGYSMLPMIKGAQAKQLREDLLAKNCPNCWTPCEAYQTIAANLFKAN